MLMTAEREERPDGSGVPIMKIQKLSISRCMTMAVAAGVVLVASCSPPTRSVRVPMSSAPPPATAADGSLAGSIHAQVNAYRRSFGKPALQRHAGLDRMAREHAESMRRNRGQSGRAAAGRISHDGFEERSLEARRLMGLSDVGENVGTCRGSRSGAAGTLVTAWTGSAGHRMNLKGAWSRTGIGAVVDADGTVFAVQIFGTDDRSHLTLSNRMRAF
jgi:uncharacterized protein YkwD